MSQRLQFLIALGACAGLIAAALVLQYAWNLDPCPLCVFQRLVVMALGLVFLVAALHNPRGTGRKVYGALGLLIALAGVGLAGRQVWLQSLPPSQVPACGPGLDYILESFPLGKAIGLVLSGSGECAQVQWPFLGLSIAGWTLICFTVFAVFGLYLLQSRRLR